MGVNPCNGQNAGTVILNYKDTDTASRAKNELRGWIQWWDADGSEEWAWINSAWSSTQGLLRNIQRYDHTVLFAETTPPHTTRAVLVVVVDVNAKLPPV